MRKAGEVLTGDRLLRLNNRPLYRVADVFAVTDHLEAGVDYAVLELVTRGGHPYQLLITPSRDVGVPTCQIEVKVSRNGTTEQKRSGGDSNRVVPAPGRPRD